VRYYRDVRRVRCQAAIDAAHLLENGIGAGVEALGAGGNRQDAREGDSENGLTQALGRAFRRSHLLLAI
jgi:hypothetical protein